MKAVRLLEYGGQLVFGDVPTPTIPRDEILVNIRRAAANHLDLVEASGKLRQVLPIDLRWIPGHEFSGVVEQIGSDVAAWAPGDAVFGTTTGMGAYAEYLAVKAAAIAVANVTPDHSCLSRVPGRFESVHVNLQALNFGIERPRRQP